MFCKDHERACPRRSPLTGYETQYRPDYHNKVKGRKDAMNCYAYAVDYQHMPKTSNCTLSSCSIPFPQPGRASGYPKWSKVKGKRCPDIMGRALGDLKGSKMSTFTKKCPKGFRKIAFISDEDQDYHVVRQDSNGLFSHKPGSTEVTNRDALGAKIYDPALASWNYPSSGLNYDNFCGYLCLPATRKHRLKRGGARRMRTRKAYRR
jgi:hypothetical protein